MAKTVRVLKLVSEYVDSPDGTDSYEKPKGWRSTTMEEIATSKFGNEAPAFIERRQFDWHNDVSPYEFKRIHAELYWYGDKTGVAIHKEWVFKPHQKSRWEIFYFAFGCKHQYKELSQTESRERGFPHFGMCWHIHECQLCKHINSYDSSD